jgi:ABC-type molybdate transport system permease subunit
MLKSPMKDGLSDVPLRITEPLVSPFKLLIAAGKNTLIGSRLNSLKRTLKFNGEASLEIK